MAANYIRAREATRSDLILKCVEILRESITNKCRDNAQGILFSFLAISYPQRSDLSSIENGAK